MVPVVGGGFDYLLGVCIRSHEGELGGLDGRGDRSGIIVGDFIFLLQEVFERHGGSMTDFRVRVNRNFKGVGEDGEVRNCVQLIRRVSLYLLRASDERAS